MLPFSIRPDSARANFIWAMALQLIEKSAGYAILAVLTRTLLPAEMGSMFLAATISGLAATVISFGTEHHLVRAVATQPERALANLAEVLALRLQNLVLVYGAVNIAFGFLRPDLRPVLLLVSAYIFLEELWYGFSAFFTGQRRIRYRLVISAVLKSLTVAAVSGVAYFSRSLTLVLVTYVLMDVILVTAALLVVRRDFGRFAVGVSWRRNLELMRTTLPFFLYNIFAIAHMRLDTLMVGFMLGVVQVAYYDLGVKLLEVARFLVRPFHAVFYPIFSDLAARGRRKVLRRRALRIVFGAVALGVIGALGMLLFADEAILLLFGGKYSATIQPTRVLFLALPFVLLHYVLTTLANALHLERTSAWLLAGSAVLNLGLNLYAIPRFGIMGAAWTTVISQSCLAGGMLLVTTRRLAARAAVSGGPPALPPEPL